LKLYFLSRERGISALSCRKKRWNCILEEIIVVVDVDDDVAVAVAVVVVKLE
jgi:hypothetical protein